MLGAMMIAGCAAPYSEAPLATNFPTSKQQKLQAASHWEVISADIAARLTAALPEALSEPLYVEATQSTPFNRAVKDQLITTLVNSGHTVVKALDGAVKVEVDTQIVAFSSNRSQYKYIGVPTALAGGAWAMKAVRSDTTATAAAATGATALLVGSDIYAWFKSESASGATPQTEIIVNVSVSDADRYLARSTTAYYVTDTDRALYEAKETKTLQLVGD